MWKKQALRHVECHSLFGAQSNNANQYSPLIHRAEIEEIPWSHSKQTNWLYSVWSGNDS